MDVDAVVSSLAERDKWQHRLAVLTESLGEVRARRTRWKARLRRLEVELGRIAEVPEHLIRNGARASQGGGDGATAPAAVDGR